MSLDYHVVALGLLTERESADTVTALAQAGVRAIVLKGPLQQSWLEAAGPPRSSLDIDLLVGRAQLEAAEAVLQSAGYATPVALPVDAGQEHSSTWVARGRMPIELHWSLVGTDESKLWDVLANQTERVMVMGQEIEIPNEPARCAIVALHAAQHGIGEAVIFHDLDKALVVAPLDTWRDAARLATAVGGWTPFAAALAITPRGSELLASFGAAPPVLDDREALSLLTPAPTSRGFYLLARERGARAKTAFVLGKIAPSPTFMRLRYPLAQRGPAGLVAAYLYRPFWLVRWSGPGLRSWLQARRLARSSRAGANPDVWLELGARGEDVSPGEQQQ